jgi:hypothetical protein
MLGIRCKGSPLVRSRGMPRLATHTLQGGFLVACREAVFYATMLTRLRTHGGRMGWVIEVALSWVYGF